MTSDNATEDLTKTGVPGLDEVLYGGLPSRAVYLLQGAPGTGKTTIGLQFLMEGVRRGERCVFLTTSQTSSELKRIAGSHGFDLDGIDIREITPGTLGSERARQQSVLHTDEVELDALLRDIHALIEKERIDRMVVDSLLEFRMLADDLTYRRELLALKYRLIDNGITTLLIDYRGIELEDRQLEGIVHGVVSLHRRNPPIGITERSIEVEKMRGHDFLEGRHDLRIGHGGVAVYSRIIPDSLPEAGPSQRISSGVDELDRLLGGGLETGTATIIVGQSGVGKSTLSGTYACNGVDQVGRAALFLFEERPEVYRTRSDALGIPVGKEEKAGRIDVRHHVPSEISAGEFGHMVVEAVEKDGARIVVIDSLSGFMTSMTDKEELVARLHALLSYLGRRGVLTIMTLAQHGLLDTHADIDVDLSFMADSIILLRQFSAEAQIRRSIAVVKKRHTAHETDICEFRITGHGVEVGGPVSTRSGLERLLGSEYQ